MNTENRRLRSQVSFRSVSVYSGNLLGGKKKEKSLPPELILHAKGGSISLEQPLTAVAAVCSVSWEQFNWDRG